MEPTKEIWQCFKCETLNEADMCFICGTLKTDIPAVKKIRKPPAPSYIPGHYDGREGYIPPVPPPPSGNKNGLVIAMCALIIVVFLFIIFMLMGM